MRDEVREWVQGIVAEYQPQPSVLEVGACNINGTIRDLLPQEGYVALDKRPGAGVDVICDICETEYWGDFGTVVCVEALEHIERPWVALPAMRRALRRGGLFIGTWCFRYDLHDEPEDYWRATPAGFRLLLEDAGFSRIRIDTQGDGPVGVFAVGVA